MALLGNILRCLRIHQVAEQKQLFVEVIYGRTFIKEPPSCSSMLAAHEKTNRMVGFFMVRAEGIEPPLTVPKTAVLSVELRPLNM